MFSGIYNGSQKHPADLDIVLDRSWSTGLDKIIITVGTINEVDKAAEIASKDGKFPEKLFSRRIDYKITFFKFDERPFILHDGLPPYALRRIRQ